MFEPNDVGGHRHCVAVLHLLGAKVPGTLTFSAGSLAALLVFLKAGAFSPNKVSSIAFLRDAE